MVSKCYRDDGLRMSPEQTVAESIWLYTQLATVASDALYQEEADTLLPYIELVMGRKLAKAKKQPDIEK